MPEILFYDGHCGLCHRFVRFVLAVDRDGSIFHFAPLGGETFLARVPDAARPSLPDSIVVLTEGGELLTRSAAVLHSLRRLGGVWRALGAMGNLVPVVIRDRVYDFIARIRHKLFRRPPDVCPVVPLEWRSRFER